MQKGLKYTIFHKLLLINVLKLSVCTHKTGHSKLIHIVNLASIHIMHTLFCMTVQYMEVIMTCSLQFVGSGRVVGGTKMVFIIFLLPWGHWLPNHFQSEFKIFFIIYKFLNGLGLSSPQNSSLWLRCNRWGSWLQPPVSNLAHFIKTWDISLLCSCIGSTERYQTGDSNAWVADILNERPLLQVTFLTIAFPTFYPFNFFLTRK